MSIPQHCPTARELDDLELLLNGALAPLTGFGESGSPVTLSLPDDFVEAEEVELVDPEGLPLARLTPATGAVRGLSAPQHGPFRRLHLSPAETRERYAGAVFTPVAGPLGASDLSRINAARQGRPVVLLALAGHGTPSLSGVALVRATMAAADLLGAHAHVVVVPLPAHDDADADHALGVRVVGNYAGDDQVLALPGQSAHDGSETPDEPDTDLAADVPADLPDEIAAIVRRDRPAPDRQGLVVFFTGLSGSGKSTLAQALIDRILEAGVRTVTSLDGDVVRRNLSAGLTFSKADRETNIRRIGWVAAEIARHGGVAICSPIAPFAETREHVRGLVADAGGAFFEVHVATPLEECERRDRKGLYAKARRGEIPEFTGISSPYEVPEDPAVRVDTTGRSIAEALDDVLEVLREDGFLDVGPADDGQPLRVLFVCTANICRSPSMELLARAAWEESRPAAGPAAGAEVVFSSAGTHGFADHEMDPTMAAALGLDASAFRSRALTGDLIAEADLVLTAQAEHRALVLEEHPQAFRKVFTLGQFVRDAAGRPETGRTLLAALAEQRTTPDPALDVADPYRRGEAAAAESVASLRELIAAAVRALG